jgi:hypothetical protein
LGKPRRDGRYTGEFSRTRLTNANEIGSPALIQFAKRAKDTLDAGGPDLDPSIVLGKYVLCHDPPGYASDEGDHDTQVESHGE